MKATALRTIKEYEMIAQGNNVLACVSGGADSMALVYFLFSNKDELGIKSLFACHYNHGIRGESSDSDEQLVRDFCEKLGVELVCENGHMLDRERPGGESEESFARILRYEFFERVAAERDALIAVAHNKNDVAETVIFNLARGTGLRGARGIPPVRGNIIRPLISVSREEIENYCAENGIDFATDETNLSDIYSRNRIRHNVLPELIKINSGAVDNLARFAAYAGRVNELLEAKALERLEDSAISNDSYSAALLMADGELCAKIALKLLCDGKGLSSDETSVILAFQVAEGSLKELQMGPGLYLRKEGDKIFFRSDPEAIPSPPPVTLRAGTNVFGKNTVKAEFISLPLSKHGEKSSKIILNNSIDCDKIIGNIVIRGRKEGDTFSSNRRHNTKTLKKLFQEMRISPENRASFPVVCDGEGVVWIPHQGVDSRAACDKETKNIIFLTLEGDL